MHINLTLIGTIVGVAIIAYLVQWAVNGSTFDKKGYGIYYGVAVVGAALLSLFIQDVIFQAIILGGLTLASPHFIKSIAKISKK